MKMADGFDIVNVITISIHIYSSIKKERLDIFVGFLNGRDVFVVLPTGFGKTLC